MTEDETAEGGEPVAGWEVEYGVLVQCYARKTWERSSGKISASEL